jgi:hypothetical protein
MLPHGHVQDEYWSSPCGEVCRPMVGPWKGERHDRGPSSASHPGRRPSDGPRMASYGLILCSLEPGYSASGSSPPAPEGLTCRRRLGLGGNEGVVGRAGGCGVGSPTRRVRGPAGHRHVRQRPSGGHEVLRRSSLRVQRAALPCLEGRSRSLGLGHGGSPQATSTRGCPWTRRTPGSTSTGTRGRGSSYRNPPRSPTGVRHRPAGQPSTARTAALLPGGGLPASRSRLSRFCAGSRTG